MNMTNVMHGFYAILMQFILTVLTCNVWIGAAFVIGFFLAREHAQKEYKYAKDVKTLKWWQGFTGWSTDNWLDFIVPVVVVCVIGFIAR